jgi:DNA-binding response OmpR family regulator
VLNKVLVVDDSRVIRRLLVELLEISGLETCSASDGWEAIEVFQREQPDLLISDLHMPKMNGFELTRKVRAFSDVPILILTGGSGNMGDDRVAAIDAGADAFLMKPFGLDELRVRIKELLLKPSCV